MLQGFTRGILALRSLHAISSHLIPTLPPPPPVQLLDAPPVSLDLPDEFRMPYPTTELIVVEPQPLIMPSFIPSYQSSLVTVTPNSLPDLVPLLLMLAIISGFVCFLPELAHILTTISKTISVFANASSKFLKSFRSKPTSNPVPAGTPSQRISFQSLLFFVSVLFAWTGPVRSQLSLPFIYIDRIPSLPSLLSSCSSGSCASFSPPTRNARKWYVCLWREREECVTHSGA
jgi:hypothetical protein